MKRLIEISKVISVRLPDKLYFQLKKSGRPIKDVTIEALKRYFYYDDLAVTPVNNNNSSKPDKDITEVVDLLLKRREDG